MQTTVFSAKPYDRRFLDAANARHGHDLRYFEAKRRRVGQSEAPTHQPGPSTRVAGAGPE